jgi:hypothetical protein
MASPDVAAATYVPEWRSRPIPRPGDHVKLDALVRPEASHFLTECHVEGVVDTATLDIEQIRPDLLIRLVDDPTDYILRCIPGCDWALVAAAPIEPAPPVTAVEAGPPAETTSIVALERRLLAIQNRLEAISGEEKALKAEAVVLNGQIRETALAEEMESLPAVDGMTAYFCPVYHVERKVDEETGKPFTISDVLKALRASGHQYLISETANGNQVRALAREIVVDNEESLPPALDRVITLETRYDVRFTPMSERKHRAAPRRAQ